MYIKPFVDWVGGKKQLIPILLKHLPEKFNTYYEPFIGGSALFFTLQPPKAYISDINCELINVYQILHSNITTNQLIKSLQKHQLYNNERYYYTLEI